KYWRAVPLTNCGRPDAVECGFCAFGFQPDSLDTIQFIQPSSLGLRPREAAHACPLDQAAPLVMPPLAAPTVSPTKSATFAMLSLIHLIGMSIIFLAPAPISLPKPVEPTPFAILSLIFSNGPVNQSRLRPPPEPSPDAPPEPTCAPPDVSKWAWL